MADLKKSRSKFGANLFANNGSDALDTYKLTKPIFNGSMSDKFGAGKKVKTTEDILADVEHYMRYNNRNKNGKIRPLSNAYIKGVLHNLKIVIDYYGMKVPTQEASIDLMKKLEENGKTGNTIHNYLYAIRFWAYSLGMNFDLCMPGSVKTIKNVQVVELQEVRQLVDAGDGRVALCTVLSSICGFRREEIIKIKVKDVDLVNNKIFLHKTKNGEPVDLIITNQVAEMIKAYLPFREKVLKDLHRDCEYLIITEDGEQVKPERLSKIINKHGKKVLGRCVGPRLLRTSCGTNLGMSSDGVNTSIIASVLHNDPRTAEKYYIKKKENIVREVMERTLRF
jgi:integrase